MLKAPWPQTLVDSLNAWQQRGDVHPYTCGNESRHRELVATVDGWVCLDCDYKQDWCHDVHGPSPPPLNRLPRE